MTDDLTERERRIGLNEALFREVNERLRALGDEFGLESLDLICECGNAECAERIAMTYSEYEQLRADPTLFAVVPGHEISDVEDVVVARGGYEIVRKHEGGEAELAARTDPRS